MNKKISLGASITFMAVVAAVTFCVTWFFSQQKFNKLISNVNERAVIYAKLDEIDSIVRDNYLSEIDSEELVNAVAAGYINGLGDKYSSYLDAKSLEQRNQTTDGVLVGIGISTAQDESGYIKISEVYDDSPASAAGLKKDDLIIEVNGEDVKTMGFSKAVEAIKGEAGTRLTVLIRSDGIDIGPIEMARKNVEIPTVEYKMLSDGNGYIKIKEFNEATVSQFESVLKELQNKNVRGLVLDVRNDPGGTLTSVKNILSDLLPPGLIVSSVGKDGKVKEKEWSTGEGLDLPMVTLGNKSTASAAELFISALKDYDRAKFVGETTYGKGVMQQLFPLSDGTAVNLTVAYFNPPKSKNFDGVGIVPDFEVALTAEEEAALLDGKLSLNDDPQMKKALEVLNAAK